MNLLPSRVTLCILTIAVIAVGSAFSSIVVNPANSPWVQGTGDVISDTLLEVVDDAVAEIQSGASVTISGGIIVGQRSDPSTVSEFIASGGTVTSGYFNVSNKSEGDAYVEFSGATVSTGSMMIGSTVNGLAGVNTDILHSAGDVSLTSSTGMLRIGSDEAAPNSDPVITWTQTGGNLNFAGKYIHIGLAADNTATYTISGGTLLQSRVLNGYWGMVVGGASGQGTGTFHVDGYWDVAGVDNEIDIKGSDTSVGVQGTLKFTIYDANGTTLVNVGGVDTANMLGKVDIDLSGYTPNVNDTFDLIKGATNYGSLSLAAEDTDDWSLSVSGDILQATYIGDPPAVTVSTTAQLQSALAAASDGDLIVMTSGNYGNVYLTGYQFNSPVTVRAADRSNPPVITFMKPTSLKNVTFDGLSFFKAATVPDNSYYTLTDLYPCEDLTFIHCRFEGATISSGDLSGYGSGFGMKIRGCTDTTIKRCVFTNLSKCISTNEENGITIEQNYAYDFRQDFIYIGGTDILIADNIAADTVPYLLPDGAGDHPDMVQTHGIGQSTIRDNFFRGECQGIFGDASPGDNYVLNNILQVSARNAITMNNTEDSLIAHNTVLGDDSSFFATVEAQNSSQGTVVEYNVADRVNTSAGTGVTYQYNEEVQRDNSNDPDYYADVFVDALEDEDASIYDYDLLPGVFTGLPEVPGADLDEFFWLSAGDPSDSSNELYPLWLQLDTAGRNKLLGLLELD